MIVDLKNHVRVTSDECRFECQETVLEMLLQALACAEKRRRTPWDYAVPLHDVRKTGILDHDLRGLVEDGVVEHAHEKCSSSSGRREFEQDGELVFNTLSCFVLSDSRGVGLAKVQVGVDDLEEMQLNYPEQLAKLDLPRWDAASRELWVGGELVKRFDWRANEQVLLLDHFEHGCWLEKMENPFRKKSLPDAQQLRDTIQNFNRSKAGCHIRLRSTSGGKVVSWELCVPDVKRSAGIPNQ